MKRIVPILLLGLALTAGAAHAAGIGVGAFGGTSIPVVQEDAKTGALYGVRLPVTVVPLLRLEPFWATNAAGRRRGDVRWPDLHSRRRRDFGLRAERHARDRRARCASTRSRASARTGSCARRRTTARRSATTPGSGLGLSPLPGLEVDLRAEFVVITLDGTSRKVVNVTLGASYRFLNLP